MYEHDRAWPWPFSTRIRHGLWSRNYSLTSQYVFYASRTSEAPTVLRGG